MVFFQLTAPTLFVPLPGGVFATDGGTVFIGNAARCLRIFFPFCSTWEREPASSILVFARLRRLTCGNTLPAFCYSL